MVTPGGAAVRQDRRSGRRRRRAAAGARAAGHRVTLVLPRYRGVDTGRPASASRPTCRSARITTRSGSSSGRWRDGVTAVLVDAPELFDRDGLYGVRRTATTPTTRSASRCSAAGALEYARLRGSSGRRSSTRTTGRPASCRCTCGRCCSADPVARRRAGRVHDPQPGLSGLFGPDILPWLGLGSDLFRVDALEFWGRVSFLKGGIIFSEHDHHRQPDLRAGDPDAGVRLRLRRHPARAARRISSGSSTASTPTRGIRRPIRYLPAHFTRRHARGKADAKRALLETARPADRRRSAARGR